MTSGIPQFPDSRTADAFASSWNRSLAGSVYSWDQFAEWFLPLDPQAFRGKTVLELGFGNGSLLYHMGACGPKRLVGVELGDTFEKTRANLAHLPAEMIELHRGDLTDVDLGQFDLVYCIGVLHHLAAPAKGFRSVLRHTRPGGRFHCWVYAHEGNLLARSFVEPLRRVACRLPWWFTKYGLALPLVVPYFLYAKALKALATSGGRIRFERVAPLHAYSLWIAERSFPFFHHVAFDQLVTPRTRYFRRAEIEAWLSDPAIDPDSVYLIFRNANSWKFGGRRREIGGTESAWLGSDTMAARAKV